MSPAWHRHSHSPRRDSPLPFLTVKRLRFFTFYFRPRHRRLRKQKILLQRKRLPSKFLERSKILLYNQNTVQPHVRIFPCTFRTDCIENRRLGGVHVGRSKPSGGHFWLYVRAEQKWYTDASSPGSRVFQRPPLEHRHQSPSSIFCRKPYMSFLFPARPAARQYCCRTVRSRVFQRTAGRERAWG